MKFSPNGDLLNITNIYLKLSKFYPKIDPHDETWRLWLKKPKIQSEIFEVATGTILVQNTNWKNADQSISNLITNNITTFEALESLNIETLKELIKPSGFNKQKSIYLHSLSNFFINYKYQLDKASREDLLKVKGIGKETADSILNYCLDRPVGIVGTYTRRIFARLIGDIDFLSMKYEAIQTSLEEEISDSYSLGHFHALIVCHSQNYCQKKKPRCEECFLRKECYYGQNYEKNENLLVVKIQKKINPKKNKK